jgi:glycosyltransferase involved in cell wall biosynthesis
MTGVPGIEANAAPAPDVSVIVIFKDAEPFLREAIESVRAQTLKRWELLLVDDGSIDGSTAVARHYAEQDHGSVRYLEHPGHENRGMSATRNLGVAHARGDFVAFLDADDALVPTALEQQVRVLRAHPRVGMVYGPLEYWYGWTGDADDRARDFVYPVGVPAERIYEPPTLVALFIQNIAFAPSGMLLRRSLVEQVGGFEESFRDLYEDQVFAAKICRTAQVYVADRCWYRYRQHPSSCCLTAEREGRLEAAREHFLGWLIAYLEREGLAGDEAWRLARIELGLERPPRGRRFPFADARGLVRRLATLVGAGGGSGR